MKAFFDPHHPLTWLAGSVVLAVAATNLAWLIVRRDRLPERAAATLPALAWLARSVFWLLPPLLAWRAGALSFSFMGIAEIDWVQSLASGAPVAAAVSGLILFGWLIYRRTRPQHAGGTAGQATRIGRTAQTLVDAALLGWHWAFYRAAAIGWLAALPEAGAGPALLTKAAEQPLYWGSWLGLACIALEWALNPLGRAELRIPGRQEAALRRIALAFSLTAIFVLSRNLWLCLAAQIFIETAIAGWFPVPVPAPQPD